MKKIVSLVLAVLMIATLGLTVFAEDGGFVESPSGNRAPRIISFRPGSDKCTGELVVTAYAERYALEAEDLKAIEAAYDEIKFSADLTKLTDELADLAKEQNIPSRLLAVSDLFDAHLTGCPEENHGSITISLEADTLENFVGLLHRNNGTWELIENATVEGKVLTFTVETLSPFAIVVGTEEVGGGPAQTGDDSNLMLWTMLALVSCGAVITLSIKSRKFAA